MNEYKQHRQKNNQVVTLSLLMDRHTLCLKATIKIHRIVHRLAALECHDTTPWPVSNVDELVASVIVNHSDRDRASSIDVLVLSQPVFYKAFKCFLTVFIASLTGHAFFRYPLFMHNLNDHCHFPNYHWYLFN